jgi:hypothetical protein
MKSLRFIAALIFSLSAFQVSATHIMGGNITYQCIGNSTYKLTAEIYRDCNGIMLQSSLPLTVSSASCGQSFTVTLELIPSGPEIVTPICATETDRCNFGQGIYGIQKFTYTHIAASLGQGISSPPVILSSCSDWIISYTNCCRNNAISTGSASDNFYIQTELNNVNAPCNNSPVFDFDPILFGCVGDTVKYSHGVSDIENDSLVFSLTNCLEAPSNSVGYFAPYSATNPLLNSYISVDALTGTLTFVPTLEQVGVICMLVEEYRNGLKIGEVTRDIQIGILNCTNQSPYLSGINGTATAAGTTGASTMSLCIGQNACFTIDAYDYNAAQNIGVTYSNSLSGATFSVNAAGNTAQVTICWTPTSNDVGSNYFGLSVYDDACPTIGKGNYTYIIKVLAGATGNLGFSDTTIFLGNSIVLPVSTNDTNCVVTWSNNATLSCTNCAAPIATPVVTTTYYYQITCPYNNCGVFNDSVTVTVQLPRIIQGIVTRHDGQPLDNSWIHLIDTSMTNIDSILTTTQGAYSFVVPDISIYYYIKATPNSNNNDQVITYYNGSETIQAADSVPILTIINIANFSTIDTASAVGGKSIGGFIGLGTDNFTPYSDIRLILKDANGNFINDAFTDDNGAFRFYGLTNGDYKIFVDKVGIDNGLAPIITILPSQSSRDSLAFLLHSYYLEMMNPNATIEVRNIQNMTVYPNPIQTTFIIQYDLAASANVRIDILDVNGRVVKNVKKERQNAGNHQFLEGISKNNFADGIYFIRLNVDNQSITKKIIIKE